MPLPGESPATYDPTAYGKDDPDTLWLFTSLTSGSSSIITATSRLEHLLKSNKIPFKAVDVATDDNAKRCWGRRSKGKRLPGVVKDGEVLGNYEDCEEWTEFGELKQMLGFSAKPKPKQMMDGATSSTTPKISATPNVPTQDSAKEGPAGTVPTAISQATSSAAAAAAAVGQQLKKAPGVKAAVSSQEGGKKEEEEKTRGITFEKDLQVGKERDAENKVKEEEEIAKAASTKPDAVAEAVVGRLQDQERGEDVAKKMGEVKISEDGLKEPVSTPKTAM